MRNFQWPIRAEAATAPAPTNTPLAQVGFLPSREDLARGEEIRNFGQVAQGGNRESIRQALAELDRRETRRRELQQVIADINQEADAAVITHAERTGPLQAELTDVERKLVDQIVAKGPDAKLEAKAKELRQAIRDANSELEITTTRCEQRRELLEKELGSPELVCGSRDVLLNALVRQGDPKLLDQIEKGKFMTKVGEAAIADVGRTIRGLSADLALAKEAEAKGMPNGHSIEQIQKVLRRAELHEAACYEISSNGSRMQNEARTQILADI